MAQQNRAVINSADKAQVMSYSVFFKPARRAGMAGVGCIDKRLWSCSSQLKLKSGRRIDRKNNNNIEK